MDKYKCTVCGYIYRPERGDRIGDIPEGTSFEDLPDDWKCPTCNQPKMAFVEMVKK
ncbi:MAG: rubredoxin [Tissierellales bacterium]|nr:rubredoxin [Tissierellales bacterium]